MASIIDQLLFRNQNISLDIQVLLQSQYLEVILSKKILNAHQSVFRHNQAVGDLITNKISIGNSQILINFNICSQKNKIYVNFTLLHDGSIKIFKSRQKQLIAIKQILKRQPELNTETNMYIYKGKIVMAISSLYRFKERSISSWIQIYNKIIFKNIGLFYQISQKYLLVHDYPLSPQKKESFLLNLSLSSHLTTLSFNTQLSQSQSQYNYKINSQEKERDQLYTIIKNMLNIEEGFQRSIKNLYANDEKWINSKYIKQNIGPLYTANYKKLRQFLAMPKANMQRKIHVEDYIYNACKIQLLENIGGGRPIAEGGKFSIYAYTAKINLLSSCGVEIDGDNAINKIVAIKKIKPQYEKKRDQKVQHENMIIKKLKTSTSLFFPKYYGTVQKSQLNNCVIMQHIQGQLLDSFMEARRETFTFWGKLYLLVNLMHGMRVLKLHQIVHLDLKPINIMMTKNLTPKIFDFGQSFHKQVCNKDFTPGFTFPYVAPEVYQRFLRIMLKKDPEIVLYSQKQDVYALGIIISEVIFESKIFQFNNFKLQEIYFKKLIYERYFLSVQRGQMYGSELLISSLLLLIQKCLNPNPQKRPTFQWIGIILKMILNLYISSNKK